MSAELRALHESILEHTHCSVCLTNPPKLERDTMEQAKDRLEEAKKLKAIARQMCEDATSMIAMCDKHIREDTQRIEQLPAVAREKMMVVVEMGIMTMEEAEAKLDEKFNIQPKTKSAGGTRTRATAALPPAWYLLAARGDHSFVSSSGSPKQV